MPSLLEVLSGIGSALDTYSGAGSVRDLIAGENPWDQFVDPFNEEKRVSGRQMLEKRGWVGENEDQGWIPDLGDLGGFAAEALLDPTNLIGGLGLAKRLMGISKAKAANRGIEAANALSREQRAMGFMPEEVAKLTKIVEPPKWVVPPGHESTVDDVLQDVFKDHFIAAPPRTASPQKLFDYAFKDLTAAPHAVGHIDDPKLANLIREGHVVLDPGGTPKKMYHGTASGWEGPPDASRFDTLALYGPGHYTTDSPKIASEYVSKGESDAIQNALNSDARLRDLNRRKTIARIHAKRAGQLNDDLRHTRAWDVADKLDEKIMERTDDLTASAVNPAVKMHYIDSRIPLDIESTYTAANIPPDVAHELRKRNRKIARDELDEMRAQQHRLSQATPSDPWYSDYQHHHDRQRQILEGAVKRRNDIPTLSGQDLYNTLQDLDTVPTSGFDAIRHRGGLMTGGQEHNVVIALDPKNVYLPYIAKELQDLQRVASPNSLLASLAGYNTLAHSDLETDE